MNISERQAAAQNNKPSFAALCHHPVFFIAAGFGGGLLPWMPGTWGTVVAIPIYFFMQYLSLPMYGIVLLAMIIGAIYCSHVTAKAWGLHDHPVIVVDEIVGYLLTMILAPAGWYWLIIGFLLFRLFDVWKPWPIRWLDQQVHGGFGIVVDDLVAGIFAWVVMQLIYFVISTML